MKKRNVFALTMAAAVLLTACAPTEDTAQTTKTEVQTAAATETTAVAAKEDTKKGAKETEVGKTEASGEKEIILGTPYTIDTFVPWEFTSDGDRYDQQHL